MSANKVDVIKVTQLVDELQRGGRAKANNVALLIAYLKPERSESCLKLSIQALKVFFVESSHDGDLDAKRRKLDSITVASAATDDDPESVYRKWLYKQYIMYITSLLELLMNSKVTASAQVAAVVAVMESVRSECGVGVFGNELYVRLVTVLTTTPTTRSEVMTLLFSRYFYFADVRFYTLCAVKSIADSHASHATTHSATPSKPGSKTSTDGSAGGVENGEGPATVAPDELACNLYDIMSNVAETVDGENGSCSLQRSWCGAAEVGAVVASNDKNERSKDRRKRKAMEGKGNGSTDAAAVQQRASWANAKMQKRMYSEAWLHFLQLPLPMDVLRKVLISLPSKIIPNLVNPVLLADFLTYTLNRGGMLGMLGLNGIFVLVTRFGLEYPKFYDRLYQLLAKDVFAARYRAQFFKLADIFLSSALVPAYTVAAFAKKFARLGMSAPPAGAMLAIAFIHNLIRRHPSVIVLLHRPQKDAEGGASGSAGEDVYNEHEQDPAKTRAVESSLWEVQTFREHYCPQVSALATVLDKDLTDRMRCNEIDIEPLLAASYGSLFTQEVDRRIKQAAVAFYQKVPTKLFDINCQQDFEGWKLPA